MEVYEQSYDELGDKKQLERQSLDPVIVSVVKRNNEADIRILYEGAPKKGHGGDEGRSMVWK